MPKVHAQEVGGSIEVSVRATVSGEVPEMAEAVKVAVGVGAGRVVTTVSVVVDGVVGDRGVAGEERVGV